jgi:anti-sigma B factor antagonist
MNEENYMEVESKEIDGILIVKPLIHRVDATVSTQFKGLMIDMIAKGKYKIILNLSQVQFMDSSGLGTIISLLKSVATKGNIVLYGVNDSVMSLLKLTRMDRVFAIATSETEAIESMKLSETRKT